MLEPKVIFSRNSTGFWTRYFKPEKGAIYCIGGDSASGIPGRNGSAAHVINVNRHRVDAVFAGVITPENFAVELERAAYYYNKAMIAVEAMFHGLVVNFKLLENSGSHEPYANLFQHDGSMTGFSDRISSEVGWKQTEQNRNLLLSLLQTDLGYNLQDDHESKIKALLCYDRATFEEFTHFQRNTKGKPEAEQGFADDRVISCGISNAVCHTLARTIVVETEERKDTIWNQWSALREQERSAEDIEIGGFDVDSYR